MNKFQKAIYKEIKKLKDKRLKELDENRPLKSQKARRIRCKIESYRLRSNAAFRELKRQAKENLRSKEVK